MSNRDFMGLELLKKIGEQTQKAHSRYVETMTKEYQAHDSLVLLIMGDFRAGKSNFHRTFMQTLFEMGVCTLIPIAIGNNGGFYRLEFDNKKTRNLIILEGYMSNTEICEFGFPVKPDDVKIIFMLMRESFTKKTIEQRVDKYLKGNENSRYKLRNEFMPVEEWFTDTMMPVMSDITKNGAKYIGKAYLQLLINDLFKKILK